MIRKFYDTIIDGCGGGDTEPPHCIRTEDFEASTIIECDCGTHMIKVQSNVDIYYLSDGNQRVRQDIYFAMYGYGNQRHGFWERLKIAWKIIRTGKVFADQVILNPEEAKKLSTFINETLIETTPVLPVHSSDVIVSENVGELAEQSWNERTEKGETEHASPVDYMVGFIDGYEKANIKINKQSK